MMASRRRRQSQAANPSRISARESVTEAGRARLTGYQTMNPIVLNLLGLTFLVSEVLLGVVKRSQQRDPGADQGSLRLLWIVFSLAIGASYFVAKIAPHARWGSGREVWITGLVVFLAGAALRWYAIFYLGRFFTVDVRVGSDHQVIRTGPYRFIRHPSYTGLLVELLGFALCLGNLWSLVAMLVPVTMALLYRIRVEERALETALGEDYSLYRRETKRLVPFVY
jgi:protein-S-isoprenylcysteine O-methyltransferase